MNRGILALLVDDDPSFTDLSATYLERIDEDITTHVETDPEDALAYVRDGGSVDCVVSDYNMPSMDGLELFTEIRNLEPDLPFILFTGRGSEEIASEAISAGVTDYLQKDTGREQYEVLANRIDNVVGQYRAKREAAETNQQLGQIIDRISDAFFAVDRDWTIDFINERAAEYIGERPSDLVGRDLQDVLPESEAGDFYEVYRRAFQTQEPETYQAESALRPGTWIEERVFPAEDGLSVYFRDVTERVEMEAKVTQTNQKITALHDVAADVATCTSDGEIFDLAIEAAEEILELDRCAVDKVEDGHLIPRAVSEGVVSDGVYYETPVEADDSLGAETYRSGESVLIDDLYEAGYVPAESDYRSVLSAPIGSHGVFQAVSTEVEGFTERDLELTELLLSHITVALNRLASERELRTERDRFATLFENIPHAVGRGCFEDGETVVEKVNATFEDVFGVDGDAVVGDSPDSVLPDEGDGIGKDATLQGVDGREVRREAADGVRDFLLHTVSDNAREGTGEVFAIYTDITEQKQRERELQHQNERLDDFASVLSHDLQNPLNVAYGRLELVEETCECDAPAFDPVFDALDRMDALVDDVLTLARDGGSTDVSELVDAADVVERAWQTAQTEGGELVVDGSFSTVEVDPGRLREILENLFGNAVNHGSARDDSEVTVRVGPLPADDGLYVEDDGLGIPPERRDFVFERGYTTTEDGTGFGLAIVDSIADAEGWTVDVTDAEHSGTGSRFELVGFDSRPAEPPQN